MNWVAPIKDEKTLEEFKAALKEVDVKYYIMFEIGVGTGMQLVEILKLKNKDLIGKTELTVEIGTRKLTTNFKFTDEFKEIVDNFVANKDPEGYLLIGYPGSDTPLSREQAYRVFKQVGRQIGLGSIGAQTMRKTFAWRYYKQTGDIYYLQELFNHASPSITYRFIGEKPNVQVVLRKMTPEENERSRYMLYLDDNGKKRLNKAIDLLTDIRDRFDSPANNDAFYGRVDCLLEELDELIDSYENQ
ncbi:MAG: tyrosine-type recombinase/integrase [Lachnospiraceae bacterium]|nr:tyrosine-type recombinase/integrase [Lachnospiraceae bacterium]